MDFIEVIEASLRTAVGTTAIVYALAAIGLNVHFGYTGLLNFGQVGFMGVGAYGVAIATDPDILGWPLWAGILVSIGAAVVLALLLGLPTLRLRADYLAIVTIAAGEIFRVLIQNPGWRDTTGGANGINGFSNTFYEINPIPAGRYGFGPFHYSSRGLWALLVGWGMVVLCALAVGLLMRSPWGRVLKSVREDEDAARSLGKNAYGFKLQSLVVGGVLGGLAGLYQSVEKASATPGNYKPETTFFIYAGLILGGVARTWGPVLGSMLLVALLEFMDGMLRGAIVEGWIPESWMDTTQIGQVRLVLVGVGLACLVIFRPQGIFGDKREIALEAR